MTCKKCYGTEFKKDRCENCGTHKNRPVFRVGTKIANRRMKRGQ